MNSGRTFSGPWQAWSCAAVTAKVAKALGSRRDCMAIDKSTAPHLTSLWVGRCPNLEHLVVGRLHKDRVYSAPCEAIQLAAAKLRLCGQCGCPIVRICRA